jgi:hypothetical protein
LASGCGTMVVRVWNEEVVRVWKEVSEETQNRGGGKEEEWCVRAQRESGGALLTGATKRLQPERE